MTTTTTTSQYCISGSLNAKADWGSTPKEQKRNIQHLFNRMTFGASIRDINWALGKTPSQVVDILVDNALNNVPAPDLSVHQWADKQTWMDQEMLNTCNNYSNRLSMLTIEWAHGMMGRNSSTDTIADQELDRGKRFKYKMSYFWHDHFPTDRTTYNGAIRTMWYKYTLIHNAVGNFKNFVKDIGRDGSMLSYLNGNVNWWRADPNELASDPNTLIPDPDWEANENYARELLELFVMGAENHDPDSCGNVALYCQEDIEELARVFTGWRTEYWSPTPRQYGQFIFQPNLHDWNDKQIFGQTVSPSLPPSGVNRSNTGNDSYDIAWPETDNTMPMLYCDNDTDSPTYGETVQAASPDGTLYWGFKEICNHQYGRVYCGDENAFGIAEAAQEYNEVHDIIFGERNGTIISAERQLNIARHICGKLYKFFVYEQPCAATIEGLSNTFVANNWELAPVLKQLFKSEHFYDTAAHGAQIQSHLGAFFNLYTTLGAEYYVDFFPAARFFDQGNFDPNDPYGYVDWTATGVVGGADVPWVSIWHYVRELGHNLFEPPNVSGWPGFRTWMNEYSFYKLRRDLVHCIRERFDDLRTGTVAPRNTTTHETWRQLMKDLVPQSEWNNPTAITKAVAEHFIMVDLLPLQLTEAECAFREIVPDNHWPIWNLDYDLNPPYQGTVEENTYVINQFLDLMEYLLKIPENFMS